MIPVSIATEDELSEVVALKLLTEFAKVTTVANTLRKGGFGYLRAQMSKWRQLAEHQIVLVLTDLDRVSCPSALVTQWFCGLHAPKNLLLRVAVREIESWVMADHQAMRQLIGPRGVLPPSPDDLPDPKQYLLGLARKAPRSVRQDLIREDGPVLRQGFGYNVRLMACIQDHWNIDRAAERSESLRRARRRLSEAIAGWRSNHPASPQHFD